MENGAVSLDDKSTKVLYNASAYKAVEDEKIRDFLHFVSTNEPAVNEFSQTLSDTVAKLKDNEKFRKDYAAMNLHDRDIKKAAREEGISIGLQQGEQKKAVEAVLTTEQMEQVKSEANVCKNAQGLVEVYKAHAAKGEWNNELAQYFKELKSQNGWS